MPDPYTSAEFVIVGVTLAGSKFRPGDWAERLCGVMSVFGADQRMAYSPYVQPYTSGGVKWVVVDIRLKNIEPMAYNFLLNFAKDNELEVRAGRRRERETADNSASLSFWIVSNPPETSWRAAGVPSPRVMRTCGQVQQFWRCAGPVTGQNSGVR